jgi:hypothetical protein
LRGEQNSKPSRTSTRHVEHRAFPRHSLVWGIPARKDAERTLSKLEASTYRRSGKNKMCGIALAKIQCSFPSSESTQSAARVPALDDLTMTRRKFLWREFADDTPASTVAAKLISSCGRSFRRAACGDRRG